jgi:hypothetical protein
MGTLAVLAAALVLASPDAAYAPPPFVQDVNVVNTPLPVEVTNTPAAEPVQHKCVCVISGGSATTTDTVTVPSGRRLVIEFVSVRALVPIGQTPEVQIFTGTGGLPSGTTSMGHSIALPVTPVPGGSVDVYHASQPVRLYADPGSGVTIHVARFQTTGTATFEVTFSGHLVTLP